MPRLRRAARRLANARDEVDRLVKAARDPEDPLGDGAVHTWTDIGEALGLTRQAAQQRYGRGP